MWVLIRKPPHDMMGLGGSSDVYQPLVAFNSINSDTLINRIDRIEKIEFLHLLE